MNLNKPIRHSELDTEWNFEGTEFLLPNKAGTGCMQVADLSGGGKVYCSEYRVRADCTIDASADAEKVAQLLCSQVLLSGQLTLETAGGKQHANTPSRSLLMRIRQSGGRLHLPGNQVIRHIGVTLPLKNDGLSCPEMNTILSDFKQVNDQCLVRPVFWQRKARTLATELFQLASKSNQPLQALKRGGLARCFLACLLEDYANQQHPPLETENKISIWEEQSIEQMCEHIQNSLAQSLKGTDLAKQFGLSPYRINELFHSIKGQSVSDYIREQRLTTAKEQIESEGLPVKIVAHNVGYRHVSNFTNAYRQYFGITPGRSQSASVQCESSN